MASGRLTDLQQEFLKQLFDISNGNIQEAAKAVGVDDYSSLMTEELISAIKKRADTQLVLNVPKAVHVMNQILNNPGSVPFMDKIHKVAADVLDRAGISKQDRSIQGTAQIGLVFLPTLNKVPEPPDDEESEGNGSPTAVGPV